MGALESDTPAPWSTEENKEGLLGKGSQIALYRLCVNTAIT